MDDVQVEELGEAEEKMSEEDVTRLNKAVDDIFRERLWLRKICRRLLISIALLMASIGMCVFVFLRTEWRWPYWMVVVDLITAIFCFFFRRHLLRRASCLDCAAMNIRRMLFLKWNESAFEHHYDQAMAALKDAGKN